MSESSAGPAMVEARVSGRDARRAYDLLSRFYGFTVAPFERKPRRRALDLAAIRPGERVLEVAVGTGANLVEILKRLEPSNVVRGIDLSPRMLRKARRAAERAGFSNLDLREADARALPFDGGSFDVLYNGYMLDLIPLDEIPVVLAEFRRVLRPGGRLVLLNLSKDGKTNLWESLYRAAPAVLVPYLFGGCRPVVVQGPVRQAGFHDVRREFISGVIPSEIVTARR